MFGGIMNSIIVNARKSCYRHQPLSQQLFQRSSSESSASSIPSLRFHSSRCIRSNVYISRNKHFVSTDSSPSTLLNKRGDRTTFASSSSTTGSIVMRQQERQRALSTTANKNNMEENPFNNRRQSNALEDDLPPITLDNTIRMKNAALATTLIAFCFGIAYYSMYAVGQSGTKTSTTSDGTTDDPLAVLKAEAAIAQEKHDKEQQTTASTADMLQKFEKGEYDPDHVSDDELDDLAADPKKKKPWWKLW